MEREVPSSPAWNPGIGRVGTAQSRPGGGRDWTRGGISLPRGWSEPGTGFLERRSMPQASQGFGGVWTVPLRTCFNFLLSPEAVRQRNWMIVVGPFQLR